MRLMLGDCLDRMKEIPAGSVDMVLCDLPYGTTQNRWDSVIPLAPLWTEYWRLCRRNAVVVLTAAQPFTSALVASQVNAFKYDLIWYKSLPTGHLNAKKMPLRQHESILVFGDKITYNPQYEEKPSGNVRRGNKVRGGSECYGAFHEKSTRGVPHELAYPRSVLNINSASNSERGLHPTQKPVALLEYLIRTYTHEGETVLDNTMGSGSTGVACINTGRKFIGIERDPDYFAIAEKRFAENETSADLSTNAPERCLQPQLTLFQDTEKTGSPSRARTCDNSINS